MIIKTRASLAEKVRAAVKEMHSYTTPAILVVPLESVDPDQSRLDRGRDGGSRRLDKTRVAARRHARHCEEQQRRSDLAPSCLLD